eukprot:g24369.t1
MSDVALKDLATAALALLYATECAVALLLPRGRRAMLRLVWATSGDPVCTLDADELQWLEEHHNSVRALKELLASPTRLHVTRFRLRLMLQGCFQVLSDSEILSLPQNLELVLLELLPPKVTHTERLIGACMQNRVHRDPNDQDEEGRRPLHFAAAAGHVRCVNLLLEAKASQEPASDNLGRACPLHFAAGQGHLEVVRVLLAAGAEKDQETDGGATPLHVACEEGYADVVRHLIECGADKDKARSDDGATPLLLASLEGHLEVVRTLLEVDVDKEKATSDTGTTPLHEAVRHNRREVMQLLLERRADAEPEPNHRGDGRLPPTFLVASGADKDLARTDDGTTPLLLGVLQGHLEVARVLLELGVETDKATTDDGTTALHLAVRQYDLHMVQLLLDFGARPDVTNALGDRPLDVALRYEDQDMVDLLSSSVHPKRRKLCPRSTGFSVGPSGEKEGRWLVFVVTGMLGALAPQVLWHGGSCLVLWKPPHWQVDEREPKEEEIIRDGRGLMSPFLQAMLPKRRHPVVYDPMHQRGFLHRLDVPSSGLIVAAASLGWQAKNRPKDRGANPQNGVLKPRHD